VRPVPDVDRRSSGDGTATVEHVVGGAALAGGGASPPPPLYRGGHFGVRTGDAHFRMTRTIRARIFEFLI